ncbi:hypothetical protein [Flavobacterium crocinum]|nr:hypothetical protein [Flavobacterium crocinum]
MYHAQNMVMMAVGCYINKYLKKEKGKKESSLKLDSQTVEVL